jgi:NTE family protein
VLVDAGQSTNNAWVQSVSGPDASELIGAVTDTSLESSKRASLDILASVMDQWHDQIVTWRCGLSNADVIQYGGSIADWDCRDFNIYLSRVSFSLLDPPDAKRLSQLPTSLSLPAADVDALIAGGGEALTRAPAFQNFVNNTAGQKVAYLSQ